MCGTKGYILFYSRQDELKKDSSVLTFLILKGTSFGQYYNLYLTLCQKQEHMKKSEINLTIHLDDEQVPEKIFWDATDKEDDTESSANAISLSIWDHLQANTLRIDLWTKQMPVDEMKRFSIDTMGGIAQTILSATGDTYMSDEINKLCDKLVEHVEEEQRKQQEKPDK
jgi:gliding motility-associated protein GldC